MWFLITVVVCLVAFLKKTQVLKIYPHLPKNVFSSWKLSFLFYLNEATSQHEAAQCSLIGLWLGKWIKAAQSKQKIEITGNLHSFFHVNEDFSTNSDYDYKDIKPRCANRSHRVRFQTHINF